MYINPKEMSKFAKASRAARALIESLGEKTEHFGGGWSRAVQLKDGRQFFVSVRKGDYIGGRFGVKGFRWVATVRNEGGDQVWRCQVPKTAGVSGILVEARVVEIGEETTK